MTIVCVLLRRGSLASSVTFMSHVPHFAVTDLCIAYKGRHMYFVPRVITQAAPRKWANGGLDITMPNMIWPHF